MKNIHFLFAAGFAATALLSFPAFAGPEARIKALEAQFAAAVNAKDVDGIMKVYVPDESLFVFDVVPPRQYVGAAAYRKDWDDFLKTFSGPVSFEVTDLAVSTDGTIGYGHSVQHMTGKYAKGESVDFTVRVTDVYRKTKGKWLIVQEHVSVPVDMETNKPDLMSKP
jgi:ketosteroid isomerase-like protein